MSTVALMSTFFALLTVVAQSIALLSLGLVVAARSSPHARRIVGAIRRDHGPSALLVAWLVALVATAGSLYYSETANFVPCELCWFQRIAMYPLVVVLGVAAWRRRDEITWYVLPLVAIGSIVSIYHYLIERFPSWSTGACDPTAPCTVVWVWKFHYISLPLMALSGFAAIAALVLWDRAARHDREGSR